MVLDLNGSGEMNQLHELVAYLCSKLYTPLEEYEIAIALNKLTITLDYLNFTITVVKCNSVYDSVLV